MRATVVKANRSYAFARLSDGRDAMFTFADCNFILADLLVGDSVEFDAVEDTAKGLRVARQMAGSRCVPVVEFVSRT